MKKLEKIYDKMFKEPNNTKYIRMVKKLTHMTDTLIIRKENPKVKKKVLLVINAEIQKLY